MLNWLTRKKSSLSNKKVYTKKSFPNFRIQKYTLFGEGSSKKNFLGIRKQKNVVIYTTEGEGRVGKKIQRFGALSPLQTK